MMVRFGGNIRGIQDLSLVLQQIELDLQLAASLADLEGSSARAEIAACRDAGRDHADS